METVNAISARSLQCYVIARCWASDLEFFKIETDFFYRLLDDYRIRLIDYEHIDRLKQMYARLLKLEQDEDIIDELLMNQLKQLELMSEDIIPEDAETLVVAQVRLENLTAGLSNEYREVKKDLFSLIKSVIQK